MANSERRDGVDFENEPSDQHTHDEMQECIEECLNCHAVCTMTLQHCIATGGDHTEVNLIGILLDCAEICQTSANFMLRGSPYHVVTCASCAELCRACEEAESCDRMAQMGGSEE
jgi:hypothetical protein